jgi:hypothetical protein
VVLGYNKHKQISLLIKVKFFIISYFIAEWLNLLCEIVVFLCKAIRRVAKK